MNILGIDTTGPDCSVGLRRPDCDDLILSEAIGRGHAEHLGPQVEQVIQDCGIVPGALDRICVATGPGSFAGTRVGVAFARGLALATGAQALGVSNLAVWALQAKTSSPLAVIHDARRDEVIVQIFDGARPRSESVRLPAGSVSGHLTELMPEGGSIIGSGAHLVASGEHETLEFDGLDMSELLGVAQAADPANLPPTPFYARPPDAKKPVGVDA